jgi:hypothetical protein
MRQVFWIPGQGREIEDQEEPQACAPVGARWGKGEGPPP